MIGIFYMSFDKEYPSKTGLTAGTEHSVTKGNQYVSCQYMTDVLSSLST